MKNFHTSLRVTTPPESEPVSLSQATAFCRVYTDYENSLISALITNARVMVEEYTARALIAQGLTWTVKLVPQEDHYGAGGNFPLDWGGWGFSGGYPHTTLELPRAPVQSITSLTVVDRCNNTIALPDTVYAFDGSLDPARLCIYWNLVEGLETPPVWPIQHIQCEFQAGYSVEPIPVPLTQAILLLTNYWYTRRADDADAPDIPKNIFWLLDQYRVYFTGATP